MRFLIVDDSSTMRRIIINTLNKLGHQDVQEAGNGKEGLERLTSGPVDMIITDWNMPEMSDIEFIRAVRTSSNVKDVPVLHGHHQRREGRHRRGAQGRGQQLRRQAVHARDDEREDRGRSSTVMTMPTTQIDSQFVNELLAATRDVFKTMVFQEVETSSPIAGDALRPGANVVGTVAFAGKTSEWHPEIGARLMKQWQLPEALEHPVRFHHDPEACPSHKGQATVAYVANRLAHRYGFGCATDSANLLEDAICTKIGLNDAWLADLDRRAPGLFQVARQIVA